MNYQEFCIIEDEKRGQQREKAQKRADKAYNKGLAEGLGILNMWLYPVFKR